jgi:hypothetical protein
MGITAAITGFLTDVGIGTAATAGATAGLLGPVTTGIVGSALGTGLEGAAIGAGTSALTGGKPLKGAELGFLGGAGAGLGPAIGSGLGIGTTAGSALGGAAGGALGGAATGMDPLKTALMGGAAGALGGATGLIDGGGGAGTVPDSVNITPSVAGSTSTGLTTALGPAAPISTSALGDITGAGGSFDDNAIFNAGGGAATGGAPSASGLVTPASTGGAGGAGPNSAAPGAPQAAKGGLFKDFSLRDALAVGGLGLSATKANAKLPGEVPLTNTAATLGTQGTQLTNYLTAGTLPPGLQAGIDQAKEAAKATIRSQFAAMGMSGQPAEAQALAQAEMAAQTQGAQTAMSLLNSGLQASQMSAELYNMILQNSLNQDRELGSAVSNFATAMAGGNPLAKPTAVAA